MYANNDHEIHLNNHVLLGFIWVFYHLVQHDTLLELQAIKAIWTIRNVPPPWAIIIIGPYHTTTKNRGVLLIIIRGNEPFYSIIFDMVFVFLCRNRKRSKKLKVALRVTREQFTKSLTPRSGVKWIATFRVLFRFIVQQNIAEFVEYRRICGIWAELRNLIGQSVPVLYDRIIPTPNGTWGYQVPVPRYIVVVDCCGRGWMLLDWCCSLLLSLWNLIR